MFSVICLASCSLDKFPLDSISPESFFSNEEELQAFSNGFYTMLPASSLYTDNADTYTQNQLPDEISGLRVIPDEGGGWTWTDLRKVNTLIEYSVNCEDEDVRIKYNALARFFRAYFYYDKIRRFGDVPWYDKQLDSDSPELKKPRDSREYVMQKMIEDIDYAIENLGIGKELYRITRWSALALKSRFCLFEGTFRKYHDINLEGHDWKWYLEQAAAASETLMNESGYSLYTADGPDKSYLNLFAAENAIDTEVILARDYNQALGVFHNSNYFAIGQTNGQPGMTRKLVASYLMSDGSRFTDNEGWQEMQFVEETANRDPRLAQSIRTPGYTRIGETDVEAQAETRIEAQLTVEVANVEDRLRGVAAAVHVPDVARVEEEGAVEDTPDREAQLEVGLQLQVAQLHGILGMFDPRRGTRAERTG